MPTDLKKDRIALEDGMVRKTQELTPLKYSKKTGTMQPISKRTAERA